MGPETRTRRRPAPRSSYSWMILLGLAMVPGTAPGRGPEASKPPTFEEDVLPILSAVCVKCHGADKPKAGLDLRTPSGVRRGSGNGAVVVTGAVEDSPLYEAVSSGKMPPGKTKLSETQVRTIRAWIEAGAPAAPDAPGTLGAAANGKAREHWAFRKPSRPSLPAVRHADRVRTPIDAFLLAALEAEGLTFSPDADPVTLIRRASLDLLGLPPTPEDVDAFLADNRPDAFERLIDRLLASPHFGERWGRHWLDVVGYADTVGFDQDANNLIMSEGKWRYRDYVIAAFNRDKPFDRFITEQLAGDELEDWRNAPHFTPQVREALIATGFLRTARDFTHEPESNIRLSYYGVLHDTVSIVGNSLMGLTIGCAQCHDHKFDPVSQRDYYRLMAALTPSYNPRDWKPVFPWKPEIKDRGLPDVSPAEVAEIERHNRELERQVTERTKRREDVRLPYEARLREARYEVLPAEIRADTKAALDTPADKRNEIQKYLAAKLESLVNLKPEEVDNALSVADKAAVAGIDGEIAALRGRRHGFGKIQALYEVGPPPPTHLLVRGDFETPGEEVQPGFLAVLDEPTGSPCDPPGPAAGATSGRRLALARRLSEPGSRASGLLARVMVNRLWQHLFGQGIVASPENFGLGGDPPSHPALLEWLSADFARNGWRVKPMLRQMLTSTAYRQASRRDPGATNGAEDPEAVDPGNRLLWRMRLRRLEAEAIRDAILAVGGTLDREMGGPPIKLRTLPHGLVEIDETTLPRPSARGKRSVYLLFRRAYNLSMLTVFDQPSVTINCPSRDASAVPLQPLTMLNDPFLTEQAKSFADRVARARGDRGVDAIRLAFRLALAREPDAAERGLCAQLLERAASRFRADKQSAPDADHRALVELCHALFNTSEFLYVE